MDATKLQGNDVVAAHVQASSNDVRNWADGQTSNTPFCFTVWTNGRNATITASAAPLHGYRHPLAIGYISYFVYDGLGWFGKT